MISSEILNILLASSLGLLALVIFRKTNIRSASDVLLDLETEDGSSKFNTRQLTGGKIVLGDELSLLGLFSPYERLKFQQSQKMIPVLFALLFLAIKFLFFNFNIFSSLLVSAIGFSFGYLMAQRRVRGLEEEYRSSLDYFLPMVMERVVMAVQAGLDIISALTCLRDLEERSTSKIDPVSRLLGVALTLSEAGIRFDTALKEVASSVNSSALRHAFIHLALAHKDGGELVSPLRELSDSTQLYYQETVEEQVAKMPVKATVPLVLTFAGLIIFFLSSPLIQILSLTKDMNPGGGFN